MPYSTSLTSYPDIVKVLDRALESRAGVRVTFETVEGVMTFCGRVHTFRHQDRKANAKIYPADHHMHGASVYDPLTIKRRKDCFQVEVIKLDAVAFDMVDIDPI